MSSIIKNTNQDQPKEETQRSVKSQRVPNKKLVCPQDASPASWTIDM